MKMIKAKWMMNRVDKGVKEGRKEGSGDEQDG